MWPGEVLAGLLLCLTVLMTIGYVLEPLFRRRNRTTQSERRAYWTLMIAAVILCSVAAGLARGVTTALIMAPVFALRVVGDAFVKTNFLKIRGRIFALIPANRRPDPPEPVYSPFDRGQPPEK